MIPAARMKAGRAHVVAFCPEAVAVFQRAAKKLRIAGEVAEAALAYAVSDKVVAAYRRTDFLEKRRALMAAWGAYCALQEDNVVRLAPMV